jgi:hypothetical protein
MVSRRAAEAKRWIALLILSMNLEIKGIYYDEDADTGSVPASSDFNIPISVEIGEKGREGAERFHFVAISPGALVSEVSEGEFKILRGHILMPRFDLNIVRRSIETLVNHARSRENWGEVLSFFNRYGVYDSEDLDRSHSP